MKNANGLPSAFPFQKFKLFEQSAPCRDVHQNHLFLAGVRAALGSFYFLSLFMRPPVEGFGARVEPEGLPPAFIGVGSIDLFGPEDIEYAQRLLAAGVGVELNVVPGAFHAFDGIAPDDSLSRLFAQAWREALRRAFTQAA
jgi:acetyl esterase/lipase